MKKVKVLNIKTGRVVSLLETTYNKLVKAGKGKDFDLVSKGSSASSKPTPAPVEDEIEEVEVEEATETTTATIPTVDENGDGKRSAKEMISAIRKAETAEAVNVLVDGEDRKTVLKAAQERKAALK